MAPLIVLIVSWIVFRGAGAAALWTAVETWTGALRFALAVMFVFTAAAHFVPATRGDLVRMVPPQLPHAALLVTLTGMLELAGAIGLLLPATRTVSAYALTALLVALFPANVRAAQRRLTIGGRAATPLAWRLPLQLFWIGLLLWIAQPA
jgi:uncharacterized membrane protein